MMEVTDKLLHGMAMQAANMVKTELHLKRRFSGLLASYVEGEGLRRMRLVEQVIIEKCGPDWIDHPEAKAAVWEIVRESMKVYPIDAFVFASIVDLFLPTKAFDDLPYEEQKRIAGGDDGHPHDLPHYFKPVDAIAAVAQTPERVCLVQQKLHGILFSGEPQVIFAPQSDFKGLMKVFDNNEAIGRVM